MLYNTFACQRQQQLGALLLEHGPAHPVAVSLIGDLQTAADLTINDRRRTSSQALCKAVLPIVQCALLILSCEQIILSANSHCKGVMAQQQAQII